MERAREHGVFPTAKAWRLEYGQLKRWVDSAGPVAQGRVAKAPAAAPRRVRTAAPPALVELIAPRPGSFPECLVELEGPRGRMRMQFKGMATAEQGALRRALWESK